MKGFTNVALLLLLPLVWNMAFVFWCVKTRNEAPLINPNTLAFIDEINNRLIDDGNDHLVLIPVDTLDNDKLKNKNDFGRQDSTGLYVYDVDSLFVIYSDSQEKELIEKVHQYALSAIEPMKEVMGHYVYPYMINGRKLPIYLCCDEDVYQTACRGLSNNSEGDYSSSWGLCTYTYVNTDVTVEGIALNYGSIKRQSDEPDLNLHATVWHEMNHYVYFQSIDLSHELSMYTWVYEGLAEYFASHVKRQTTYLSREEKNAVGRNELASSFNPFLFNYSGGELFYDYIESEYGEQAVYQFVKDIYTMRLDLALKRLGMSVDSAEYGWVQYIKNSDVYKRR